MERLSRENIKEKAESHVAYGWARSPGTHRRDVIWTEEDTKLYNEFFDEALKNTKGATK